MHTEQTARAEPRAERTHKRTTDSTTTHGVRPRGAEETAQGNTSCQLAAGAGCTTGGPASSVSSGVTGGATNGAPAVQPAARRRRQVGGGDWCWRAKRHPPGPDGRPGGLGVHVKASGQGPCWGVWGALSQLLSASTEYCRYLGASAKHSMPQRHGVRERKTAAEAAGVVGRAAVAATGAARPWRPFLLLRAPDNKN